jgi:acetyl esterase/lipase
VLTVSPVEAPSSRGAMVHLHPGGFVIGSPDQAIVRLRQLAAQLNCVIVSVDYPLAPEARFPKAIEDSYSVLRWVAEESSTLGVDPNKIGLMGESAGGGLAAALALLARDRGGPRLAFQNLLYPMLDDRTTGNENLFAGQFVWTRESNSFSWESLLGTFFRTEDVSPYAAPARAKDLTGLPPTYIAVGSLDLLVDEDVEFARRLTHAGVPGELAVYPGATHGFNQVPDTAITKRATRQRMDAFSRALTASSE